MLVGETREGRRCGNVTGAKEERESPRLKIRHTAEEKDRMKDQRRFYEKKRGGGGTIANECVRPLD